MNDIISPNDINIAQDELFKTIELLCERYMKDMNKADETIECKIIDASNATNHIYTVITSNNVKLDVQSENTEYEVDDRVQVLIPQGNYNAVKRIIGKCYNKQDYDKQLDSETFLPMWTYITSSYSKNLYITNALKPKLFVNCAVIEEIVQNNDDSSWTINGDFYVSGEEYLENQYYRGILRAEIYQNGDYKDLLNGAPAEGQAYYMDNITFEGFPYLFIQGNYLDFIASTNMLNLSYRISELNGNNVMKNSSSLLRLQSETQEWSGTNTFNMFGNGLQENKLYCDSFHYPLDMWKSFKYSIFFPNISIKMIDQDESPDNVLCIYIANSFMVLGQHSSSTLALYSKGKPFEYYTSYNKNLLADPYLNKLRIWLCNSTYLTNMDNYVSGKIVRNEHLNSPLFENKIILYSDTDIPTYELYDAWIRTQDFYTTVTKDMVAENQLIIYPNSHNSTVIDDKPYFGIRMYLDPNAILENEKKYVVQGNITHQYDHNVVGIKVRYGNRKGPSIITLPYTVTCRTQLDGNTLLANNFSETFTYDYPYKQENIYIDLFFPFSFGFVQTYKKGTQFTIVVTQGSDEWECKLDADLQTVVSIVAYDEQWSTEDKAIFYAVEMIKNIKLSETTGNNEKFVDLTLLHEIHLINGEQILMYDRRSYMSDSARRITNKTSEGGYYTGFSCNNLPTINSAARLKCLQICLQSYTILSHADLSYAQLVPSDAQGGGGFMGYQSYNFPITLQEFSVMDKDDMILINVATGKKLNLRSTSGFYDYGQDPPQHYLEWNFVSGGINGSGETFFPKRGVDAYELQNTFIPQWRNGFDDNHPCRTFCVKLYENGSVIEQQTITLQNLGERSAE